MQTPKLGKKFSKEENNFIKQNYPRFGSEYCAKELNRTKSSIKRRVEKLKIRRLRPKFTKEEDNFLKKHYVEFGAKYCSRKINKTLYSIYCRIKELKIPSSRKKFTEEECNFILKNYLEYGTEYCAFKLNRSYSSIEKKVKKLNIQKNKNIRYSKEEDDFLIQNYSLYGIGYCSQKLNKPEKSIKKRIVKLKIGTFLKCYTHEEDDIIRKNYPEYGGNYCASLLNKSYQSVKDRARRLKIKVNKCGFSKKLITFFVKYYSYKFGEEYCNKISNFNYKLLNTELRKIYEGRLSIWIINSLDKIKRKNIDTDIDCDFLYSIYSEYCPILGIKLKPYENELSSYPSLDKINPNLGYIKSNVFIISHRANNIKRDAVLEDTKSLILYLQPKNNILNFRTLSASERKRIDKIFLDIKSRSKLKNIQFNLTREYLYSIVPDICPITKNKIDFSGKDKKNSPSVDRFDNNRGYTIDNVKIISYQGNCLKGSGTLEEHKKILVYLENKLIN